MKFLLDENFNGPIAEALVKAYPHLDMIRVQDSREGLPDNKVLEWAASEDRVVVTHDVRTMPAYAYDRVRKGLPMPGVIEVNQFAPIGVIVEQFGFIAEASTPDELRDRVTYIPF